MKNFLLVGVIGLMLSACGGRVQYAKNFKAGVPEEQKIFINITPQKEYKIISAMQYKTPIGKDFNSPSVREELKQLIANANGDGAIITNLKSKIVWWGCVTWVLLYTPTVEVGYVEIFTYTSAS
jgi:hypothetical protein